MKINPKFKSLIPPLAPDELAQLEANLLADGCRDPLVTWNDTLLDGHNRLAICEQHKLLYKTKAVTLADEDAALLWIIDNQKGRRNLPQIDAIALQGEKEKILARQAKAQQIRKPESVSAKLPKQKPINTRSACAAAAGVGERTYDAGKLILQAAAEGRIKPEVVEDVRRGRAAIHRVAKDIKENLQREERAAKRLQSAGKTEIHSQIIVGDFSAQKDKITDGSLSLIFTDPPYDRKASRMLPALADFAERKLADGGSLLCYVGQTQLPSALDALRGNLRYWWTVACIHSGKATVMREYGIDAGWKAVLWFVKGTRDNNSVMVSDVMSGGEEKSHHDWQQSESEAAYWIEKLCPKNGIVCDPFLGSGTTALAAKKLKRQWIGFEIDEATAKIASERIGL